MLMYQDPEGTEVRFSISFAEGKTLSVDTENAQNVETVVINGYEGILVEKPRMIEGELKERVLITLGDTDQNYFVNITTTGLGKEAAIKLAEQVAYVGKTSLDDRL